MAFEIDMAACAAHEDERQRGTAALELEEARLEAGAIAEASTGNFEKLWSAIDYRDNDREVMAALMACARGEPGAQDAARMVVKLLAKTFASNTAEVE